VHEQCPEPLFHDFEIVIVPFLQAFVDSVVYKARDGVIGGRKGKYLSRLYLGQTTLTCVCCGTLSYAEHISASLVSLLHNSRRNTLILYKKNTQVVRDVRTKDSAVQDKVLRGRRNLRFALRRGVESGRSQAAHCHRDNFSLTCKSLILAFVPFR